jgi:hypothetical protein
VNERPLDGLSETLISQVYDLLGTGGLGLGHCGGDSRRGPSSINFLKDLSSLHSIFSCEEVKRSLRNRFGRLKKGELNFYLCQSRRPTLTVNKEMRRPADVGNVTLIRLY